MPNVTGCASGLTDVVNDRWQHVRHGVATGFRAARQSLTEIFHFPGPGPIPTRGHPAEDLERRNSFPNRSTSPVDGPRISRSRSASVEIQRLDGRRGDAEPLTFEQTAKAEFLRTLHAALAHDPDTVEFHLSDTAVAFKEASADGKMIWKEALFEIDGFFPGMGHDEVTRLVKPEHVSMTRTCVSRQQNREKKERGFALASWNQQLSYASGNSAQVEYRLRSERVYVTRQQGPVYGDSGQKCGDKPYIGSFLFTISKPREGAPIADQQTDIPEEVKNAKVIATLRQSNGRNERLIIRIGEAAHVRWRRADEIRTYEFDKFKLIAPPVVSNDLFEAGHGSMEKETFRIPDDMKIGVFAPHGHKYLAQPVGDRISHKKYAEILVHDGQTFIYPLSEKAARGTLTDITGTSESGKIRDLRLTKIGHRGTTFMSYLQDGTNVFELDANHASRDDCSTREFKSLAKNAKTYVLLPRKNAHLKASEVISFWNDFRHGAQSKLVDLASCRHSSAFSPQYAPVADLHQHHCDPWFFRSRDMDSSNMDSQEREAEVLTRIPEWHGAIRNLHKLSAAAQMKMLAEFVAKTNPGNFLLDTRAGIREMLAECVEALSQALANNDIGKSARAVAIAALAQNACKSGLETILKRHNDLRGLLLLELADVMEDETKDLRSADVWAAWITQRKDELRIMAMHLPCLTGQEQERVLIRFTALPNPDEIPRARRDLVNECLADCIEALDNTLGTSSLDPEATLLAEQVMRNWGTPEQLAKHAILNHREIQDGFAEIDLD